jgi:hypothetical protein
MRSVCTGRLLLRMLQSAVCFTTITDTHLVFHFNVKRKHKVTVTLLVQQEI